MQSRPLVLTALLLALGCTPKSQDTNAQPSATASATPPPPSAPSSTPAPTASAAPSAEPTTEGTAAAKTSPPPETGKKDGSATAAAASGSAGGGGAAECGTKPLPDCPLQAWMKANANPPVMTNDLPKLAVALDKIVSFAPPGYTNWASISKDGAAAARANDLTAAKASCRTCHDQYKQKYKNEMRARKI